MHTLQETLIGTEGHCLQAQARAQAQNMAFQAHNLQAHAQQLEVESVQATTQINAGLQHQIEQVCLLLWLCWSPCSTHVLCVCPTAVADVLRHCLQVGFECLAFLIFTLYSLSSHPNTVPSARFNHMCLWCFWQVCCFCCSLPHKLLPTFTALACLQDPASAVHPASALQPGPLTQMITPTHDSNAAAPQLPAAAVAPALAKLSVQTMPTLQNPSLQAPDLTAQMQPLSHPSMVNSTLASVGSFCSSFLCGSFLWELSVWELSVWELAVREELTST